MLIYRPWKLVFIKTQKTASTSVESFLQGVISGCQPSHETKLILKSELVVAPRFSKSSYQSEPKQDRGSIWAHMTAREVLEAGLVDNPGEFTVVTTCRNPYEVVRSGFWFALRRKKRLRGLLHTSPVLAELYLNIWVLTSSLTPLQQARRLEHGAKFAREIIIRFESLESDLRYLIMEYEGKFDGAVLPDYKSGLRLSGSEESLWWPAKVKIAKVLGEDFSKFGYAP